MKEYNIAIISGSDSDLPHIKKIIMEKKMKKSQSYWRLIKPTKHEGGRGSLSMCDPTRLLSGIT
jgi:hypothetical protein